jgi:tRNA-Thr(GGU) m(6)t(6)A37 methyltransferase TsaA
MSPTNEIRIAPIGRVRRIAPEEDVKDRSLTTKIILKKGFSKTLDGIEDFSHLFIIFWLHEIPRKGKAPLKVHPRGRAELPLVGAFATRTPNRPNPIGLTLVELVKRDKNTLWVKGLDAYDGTPVIDIKPYDSWDTAAEARIPEWLKRLNKEQTKQKPVR